MEKFKEIDLKCECGVEFTWTPGEQSFMNKLKEEGKIQEIRQPKRCADCRAAKRMKFEGSADTSKQFTPSY